MEAQSEIASFIVGKLGDRALDLFRHHVIERWGRCRAQVFIHAFASAVIDPTVPIEQIRDELTLILSDEKKSEVLFDSYRAVCLSRSKILGPRAIGLLTARVIAENRIASGVEENWFEVYESFSDMELNATQDFFDDAFSKGRSGTNKEYKLKLRTLEIDWTSEDSNFKGNVDRTPLNLHEALGPWAAKLEHLGLLASSMHEEVWDYRVDSERHIDEPGTARRITYRLTLNRYDEEYAALIRKAFPPTD